MSNSVLSRLKESHSDNKTSPFVAMYSTGFPTFDFLNGIQIIGNKPDGTKYRYYGLGLIDGTFNQIIGRSGCGKTTWAIQAGANICRQFENSNLIIRSIEGGISIPRIEQLTGWHGDEFTNKIDFMDSGITTDSLFDDVMSIYNTKKENPDDYLYNTGKYDSLGNPIYKYVPTVMIIDSIPYMVPKKLDDDEDKASTNMTGAQIAQANSKFIIRVTSRMKEVNIIILAINHINDNVDTNPMMHKQSSNSYLKQDESLPGGKKLMYGSNNIIRFKDKKLKTESFGFNGLEVAITLVKSRSNRSEEDSVPMVLDYANGFNPFISNMLLLKQLDFIKQRGAYMQIGDHDDMKFTNKKFLEKYLEDDNFKAVFDQELIKACSSLLPKVSKDVSDKREKINKYNMDLIKLCQDIEETEF